MKTVKMSVKQLKELENFSAISNTGKRASFIVEGEFAVNQETEQKVKLDTIRRSWEIEVSENAEQQVEEVQETSPESSESSASNEVAQDEQQVIEEQKSDTEQVEAKSEEVIAEGKIVKLQDGRIGEVIGMFKELLTVELDGEEVAAKVDEVELLSDKEVKKFKKAQAKAQKQANKSANDSSKEKKSVGPRNRKTEYEAKLYQALQDKVAPTSHEALDENTDRYIYEFDGLSLEYTTGVISWVEGEGEEAEQLSVDWEVLRYKKQGSWHSTFFKVNGEVIKDIEHNGTIYKQPSRSKTVVKAYLKNNYGADVNL